MLSPEPARYLAGVLGVATPSTQLPPMWHLVYLLDTWARAELGSDGHALRGVPQPPAEPHRRLFAGGRTFHRHALHLGRPAVRTASVTTSTVKQGRSGPLTFVTVRNEYEQAGRVAVVDEQDIVYRPPTPVEAAPTAAHVSPAEDTDAEVRFTVDPVTLFMFSTITRNAHRIHYDVEYARSEGHPGLVVHGPLQVLLMAAALTASGSALIGCRFDYRMLEPAYGPQVLRVGVPRTGEGGVVVLSGSGRRIARGVLTS